MQSDADDGGDQFGQAMLMRQDCRVSEAIDDQHADDGGADNRAQIEDDFRRFLIAAEGGENEATDAVSHEKHDDYRWPNV